MVVVLAMLFSMTACNKKEEAQITEEEAKQIALDDAGMKESDVTFARTHLDLDDNGAEYDVEFYSDLMEYDYEINAVTGEIIVSDYDADHYTISGDAKYISGVEAKEVALKDAGIDEANIMGLQIQLEEDDGKAIYEIEFLEGQTEYNYEIDAIEGTIISREAEKE